MDLSHNVKTTLCHDITTYDILWQPYTNVLPHQQTPPPGHERHCSAGAEDKS